MGATDTERRAQQQKLAMRLKLVTVALGLVGVLLLAAAIILRYKIPYIFSDSYFYGYANGEHTFYEEPNEFLKQFLWGFSVFTVIAWAMCYKILWYFWNVCTQIGKDNSFSAENAKSFHRMANTGFAIAILYAIKLAFYAGRMLLLKESYFGAVISGGLACGLIGLFLVLFLLFGIICEALSKLIKNAYEIKAENDLTI
ncbi:MAG: DUF2975 domain-containing protein [Lachnospiraceae bacterium]|nr:DUF2975 domain-containing protein [Lachnospiraceae bacterium]